MKSLIKPIIVEKETDKVFGVNNSYIINSKKGMRFKKSEAREWQNDWLKAFLDHADTFSHLKGFYISMELIWLNPKFYTQKGEISKTAGDIDGCEKFIIDGVFQGIGLDDSLLKDKRTIQRDYKGSKHKVIAILRAYDLNYLSGDIEEILF